MSQPKSRTKKSAREKKQTPTGSHHAGTTLTVARLMERMNSMEKAFNNNTQLFIHTMQMLEVQGQAARKVIDDVYDGIKSATVKAKAGGEVDWPFYMGEALDKLRQAQQPQQSQQEQPALALPQDNSPLIFGGDQ